MDYKYGERRYIRNINPSTASFKMSHTACYNLRILVKKYLKKDDKICVEKTYEFYYKS